MNSVRRLGTLALAAVTAVGMLGGCASLEEKTEQDTVAATFDGKDIMLDYVMYQMRSAQYSYEQMFIPLYGTTDFWKQEYSSGVTIEAYVIGNVMASIRQTKVLCDYADKNGITLTDEQQQKVDEMVTKAMDSDEEYLQTVGATEAIIREVFSENALANAAYLQLVADVDTTVGDDEFIRKKVSYVKLSPKDLEEASSAAAESENDTEASGTDEETGSAGSEADETETEAVTTAAETEKTTAAEETTEEETSAETKEETTADESKESDAEASSETESESAPDAELTVEEKNQKKAINEAADEIRGRLEDGEDPSDFVSSYNTDDNKYFMATQSSVTVGDDSTTVYAEAAFALSTGETDIFTDESSGAVYVLLCTNDNDTQARQDAIDTEIENRKATLFSEKYAPIQENSPKFTVDQDVIGKISFSTQLYVPETTEAATGEEETDTETESETETSESEAASEEGTAGEASESETESETETENSSAEETSKESLMQKQETAK